MRGGVTVNDLLHIYSKEDRDILNDVIEGNIQLTKDTQMPFL